METQTKPEYKAIRRGMTEIDVPHKGGTLTAIHPRFGPGTYAGVQTAIQKAGLATPTVAETASLLHPVYCSGLEAPEFDDIKATMKGQYLWGFTGLLWVPKEGAYIQDHPEIKEGMPFMDRNGLVERLGAKDPSVRFVPFGFKIESMTPIDLGKNPLVIGMAGEEGAGKLAEIADKFKIKPYVWGFKSVNQELTRVSVLVSDWGLDVRGLCVGGDGGGGVDGSGCAFGVRSLTDEVGRAEN